MDDKTEFVRMVTTQCLKYMSVNEANKVEQILSVLLTKYSLKKETYALSTETVTPNQKLVNTFLAIKKISGLTDKSLKAYNNEIQMMLKAINKPIADIKVNDIRAYLAFEQLNKNVSNSYLDTKLRYLKSFFKTLRIEGYIPNDPAEKITKIKKAFDICKKNKIISIFGNEKGEQWLSDGYAVYPIFGLPELNEDYICKLYDINDAQRDKIRFTISQTKPLIDVEDCSADETPAEMWDISIIYDGKVMLPISTAEGLMFIDRVYLNPFVDMPNETMALALRKDFKGTPYFAVKFGMIAYGFICAYEIVDEDFVRQLKSLYIESDMILKNKKG